MSDCEKNIERPPHLKESLKIVSTVVINTDIQLKWQQNLKVDNSMLFIKRLTVGVISRKIKREGPLL